MRIKIMRPSLHDPCIVNMMLINYSFKNFHTTAPWKIRDGNTIIMLKKNGEKTDKISKENEEEKE